MMETDEAQDLSVRKRLSAILHEQLDTSGSSKDRVYADSDRLREDLGMDSLDEVEVVMTIEQEFEVNIPEEFIVDIRTFGGLVSRLKNFLTLGT